MLLCLFNSSFVHYSEDEDPEYKPLRMPFKDDLDDFTNSPLDDKDDVMEGETEGDRVLPSPISTFTIFKCHSSNPLFFLFIAKADENGQGMTSAGGASSSNERLYWPGASALTARLRRLITAYQRSNRREQLRQEALNRPDGRRRRRREFLPSIAMVTDTGAATTYIQDGTGVFVTEGSPYMAKGSGYFAKGGQFMTEPSQVMTASSLIADGGMYYKERRQRYVEIALHSNFLPTAYWRRPYF